MNIRLPYGSTELPVDVPDNWINGRCYRPFQLEKAPSEEQALEEALSSPVGSANFREVVRGKKNICLVMSSLCPQLFKRVLPSILSRIEEVGRLEAENITVLFTNSIWMPKNDDFLTRNVPSALLSRYRMILHQPANTDDCLEVGKVGDEIPLRIHKVYAEADARIIIGPVLPDIIEGFVGGRSLILPGIVDETTLRALYSYENVTSPAVSYGITRDNPFHMAGMQALQVAGCDFGFCALMTRDGHLSSYVCGDPGQATMASIDQMREKLGSALKEPMDIVVTTGGGAPFDGSLYQLINSLSAVVPIMKENGTIVCTAGLENGFGPAPLRELFLKGQSPTQFAAHYGNSDEWIPGQWIAQHLYNILKNHEVIVYSKGISEADLWQAGLTPTSDFNEAIEVAMQGHGQRCKICAFPEGPFSLPVLKPAGK
jgi:nickel-dependent lactate racemase